ncbi:TolC family outer membrane protein [Geomonas paludis]|uniref:Channel protein TolC n=1 Tax=Geomonas paludis TaxID=2740185 RepID=A0A6V8MTJ7_9BACT|nr:TolC family outer membrane protein [Geomonas paludis]UPU37997.1 TolC family outer membrane protein [Geomonas paludis]GFO63478.1 channel protein TolC [Geomonas paludis]
MSVKQTASFVLFSVTLLCSFLVFPRSALAADLLHYYNLALSKDPQLRGAEYRSLATVETLQQAYAGVLPKIYGFAGYTHTFQDVRSSQNSVYVVGTIDYPTRFYGAALSQPLFRYSSYLSIGQAKRLLQRSELELEKARQDVTLRVVEAYMNILLYQDRLAAIKAEETAVELHHTLARARFETGLAPVTDAYDAEARLAAVKAQRGEAQYLLQDAFQALVEICGERVQEVRPLKDDIPMPLPFPQGGAFWLEAARRKNLELRIQKENAEVARREVRLRESAHYPTLDFQADYNQSVTRGSLFGLGSNTVIWNAMVRLNIPLYEGGMTSSRTREAAHLLQGALQEVEGASRAVERKTSAAYNDIVSAATRAEAMKKSVSAQTLVVEGKEEGFRSGMYTSIAVLDAMQDLYRYRREYSLARRDYILSSLRLKQVTGTLTGEDVGLINQWLQ